MLGPGGVVVCRPCRTTTHFCARGVLAPLPGFWHSMPNSEDVQACPNVKACSPGDALSRTQALIGMQAAAGGIAAISAWAQRSVGPAGSVGGRGEPRVESRQLLAAEAARALAPAAVPLDLEAYLDRQCEPGCATQYAADCCEHLLPLLLDTVRPPACRALNRAAWVSGTLAHCVRFASQATVA